MRASSFPQFGGFEPIGSLCGFSFFELALPQFWLSNWLAPFGLRLDAGNTANRASEFFG
jgi:hypothetical protein